MTSQERAWILYDVGNSAFVLLCSTLIPIYFNTIAGSVGLSSADYLAYWGYAASIVTVIGVLLGPVLGTLADTKGYKKPLFLIALFLGSAGCALMGFTQSWILFLLIFVVAKAGFSCSLVFYDSMLCDVTSETRMDTVSSRGYAWGYIGSCIPFLLCLGLVLLGSQAGIGQMDAMTIGFLITAFWWIGMSLPLLRKYQQVHYIAPQKQVLTESFRRIGRTLKNARKEKRVFLFLLAFFCYIDGVYTIIEMATAYGTSLGLDTTGLLLALLVTQIVAFPSALVFGGLSARFPSTKLIPVCILAYTGIAVFAFFLDSQLEFWILAVWVGLFQGGIQALSRSHFAKIIPQEKSGEFFGLFDICGKGASFLGTMLISLATQFAGSANLGVGLLAVLFVAGLVFFLLSCRASRKEEIETFGFMG